MTNDHPKTDQSTSDKAENWKLDELKKEYEAMSAPGDWPKPVNTEKELLYYGGIYVLWLLALIIFVIIMGAGLGSTFWSLSVLPPIVICGYLYSRLRSLEFMIYKLEWKFHLRKLIRLFGKELVENKKPKSALLPGFYFFAPHHWHDFDSDVGSDDDKEIREIIRRQLRRRKEPMYYAGVDLLAKEDDLFYKAVKVVMHSNQRIHPHVLQENLRIGYTKATQIIKKMVDLGILYETGDMAIPRGINKKKLEKFLAEEIIHNNREKNETTQNIT